MDFLYFPEDKSEYIPGIISVVVIFILSLLIIWLLVRASRKQVKQLEDQGYPVVYRKHSEGESQEETQQEDTTEEQEKAARKKEGQKDKES